MAESKKEQSMQPTQRSGSVTRIPVPSPSRAAGPLGLAAREPVDLEREAGQETVTTQRQLMEAETVRSRSLKLVTQILVQVTNVCLTPFDTC